MSRKVIEAAIAANADTACRALFHTSLIKHDAIPFAFYHQPQVALLIQLRLHFSGFPPSLIHQRLNSKAQTMAVGTPEVAMAVRPRPTPYVRNIEFNTALTAYDQGHKISLTSIPKHQVALRAI